MKSVTRSALVFSALVRCVTGAANPANVLTGQAAIVTTSGIKPGEFRKITTADLPKPFMTESATLRSKIVARPAGMIPLAPAGFHVNLFADGLLMPRVIRVAPNGDAFLAETQAGQVRVFRVWRRTASRARVLYLPLAFMNPTAWCSIPRGRIRNGSTWRIPIPWCATRISLAI